MENEVKNTEDKELKARKAAIWGKLLEAGTEFALILSAPLVFFVFLGPILRFVGMQAAGNWASNAFGHNKAYTVIGILGALGLSFYMIGKKIMEYKRIMDGK